MDSTLVYLNAVVLGHEKMGNEWVYEMQSGQEMFQAVLPATNKVVSWVDIGSLVRVCGVCQIEPNPFPELGKKIASFKILLASPSSVVVVKSPPWWTLSRALAIAGGLAVILVMATAWIGILRYQVGVQTSQLKAEIEQHKQAEEQLAIKTAMAQPSGSLVQHPDPADTPWGQPHKRAPTPRVYRRVYQNIQPECRTF